MYVGIIAAMQPEVEFLIKEMKHRQEKKINKFIFNIGELANKKAIVLQSGIGKVNAAIATSLLINNFEIDYVINTGSAGGFIEQLQIEDVVLVDNFFYHDVDLANFGYQLGQIPGEDEFYQADPNLVKIAKECLQEKNIRHHLGSIGTGDSFVYQERQVRFIKKNFPRVVSCDMESTAIAQTCKIFNKKILTTRIITDNINSKSTIDFKKFIKKAGIESATITMDIIKKENYNSY